MRLFVAAWPPPEVVASLHELSRPDVGGVRWSTEDQWHVTLRFLGDVERVDDLVDALSSISIAAAEVIVGPATSRLGAGILMVPVHGLDAFARAVHEVTEPFVSIPEHRPFKGHVTVARARSKSEVPRLLEGTPFSASWTATSFALVRSQTKPTGAVYTDVETFSLP